MPTPDEELAQAGTTVTSAWAGGYAGRRVIDRLLAQVGNVLILLLNQGLPLPVMMPLIFMCDLWQACQAAAVHAVYRRLRAVRAVLRCLTC